MLVIYWNECVWFSVALRAAPVLRKPKKGRARWNLLDLVADLGVIDVPTYSAFKFCIVCKTIHAASDQYGASISRRRTAESPRSSAAAATTCGMLVISSVFRIRVPIEL